MSAISTGDAAAPPPFFIGGCYRSGLALLRLMLDSHPELSCGPESPALSFALAARDFQHTLGELHERHFDLPPRRVRENFAAAIAEILDWRREARGKKRAGEKSAMNLLVFNDLAEIFPDAQFIHVVRDGRDVAASLVERKWKSPASGAVLPYCSDPTTAMTYWRSLVQIGLEAEQKMPARRLLRIHYEDLARRPVKTIAKIEAFLGVSPSEEPLGFYARNLQQLAGLEKESAGRLREPIDASSVGRWRKEFDAATRDVLTKLGEPTLKTLGYL
jgi:hypothetical protein